VLLEALSTAARAVPSRADRQVLTGLHLSLAGDRLEVVGSDAETTVVARVDVAGEADGATVLSAKLLVDIVRALEPGSVTLDTSGERPQLRGGRSEFALNPYVTEEYPRPGEPTGEVATLPASDLAEGLRQVVGAASTDEMREVLTGVLFAAEERGLRLVATDSYRMAFRDLPGTSPLAPGQRVLVPARALNELTRFLDGNETIDVVLGEQSVSFTAGDVRLTTRLIMGDYPDYERLVPSDMQNSLVVDRQAFMDAIRRVSLVSRASDKSPLQLTMGPDGLRLHAHSTDNDEASEELDAKYEGEELMIAFNPTFLEQGLAASTGDEVTLQTRDAHRPAVIRCTDSDDFLYLLMPVRTTG
jgi:DNA polymerase III subunit beta